MKKALLLYSSVDGQTHKIAAKIAKQITSGFVCELHDIHELPEADLNLYDLIILGAPIRYGFFNKQFRLFVNQHAPLLNQKKTAFFSVTLTARNKEKRTPQTNSYTQKFLENTPWKPKICGVFAGALHYPHYRWYDRIAIQMIMRMTGGETDTTKDIEYTDWAEVAAFSESLLLLS